MVSGVGGESRGITVVIRRDNEHAREVDPGTFRRGSLWVGAVADVSADRDSGAHVPSESYSGFPGLNMVASGGGRSHPGMARAGREECPSLHDGRSAAIRSSDRNAIRHALSCHTRASSQRPSLRQPVWINCIRVP